jgi:hypothetical protein
MAEVVERTTLSRYQESALKLTTPMRWGRSAARKGVPLRENSRTGAARSAAWSRARAAKVSKLSMGIE